MRAPDAVFRQWVDAARATPIGDLAAMRGLSLRGGVERVGACPHCGGHDRFGVNTRKNVFICRGGCPDGRGGGDPIDLVMLLDGCDFLRACETLTGVKPPRGEGKGLSPEAVAALEAERARNRAAADVASRRWSEDERARCFRYYRKAAYPEGTPVEAYLALRGVRLPPRSTLRYQPCFVLYDDVRQPHGEGFRTVKVEVHRGPAMFAPVIGNDGHFSGLHITWIDLGQPDGKAMVPDGRTGEFVTAKKMRGSIKGGHIDLGRTAGPHCLVIGEGIETTLSVREALLRAGRDISRVAFWCAMSLGNLGGPHADKVVHPTVRRIDKLGRSMPWMIPGAAPDLAGPAIVIPETVDEVISLGDGDSDPLLTRLAHARAATRWAAPGRAVHPLFAPAGTDFNVLIREMPL